MINFDHSNQFNEIFIWSMSYFFVLKYKNSQISDGIFLPAFQHNQHLYTLFTVSISCWIRIDKCSTNKTQTKFSSCYHIYLNLKLHRKIFLKSIPTTTTTEGKYNTVYRICTPARTPVDGSTQWKTKKKKTKWNEYWTQLFYDGDNF